MSPRDAALTLKPLYRLVVVLGLGLVLAGPASAETRYVTDQYDFNLRSGESTRYKILRALPSGTPLEIVSTNTGTGYAQVRTSDGLNGYILMRYLQDEPAARDQLAAMREELAQLQQAPDALATRLRDLQSAHASLKAAHETLQREHSQLEQELGQIRQASADVIGITRERTALQDQVVALQRQVGNLEQHNLELVNQNRQRWFMIGAAVIIAGIVLGLLLPHLRFRRRPSSWGSL